MEGPGASRDASLRGILGILSMTNDPLLANVDQEVLKHPNKAMYHNHRDTLGIRVSFDVLPLALNSTLQGRIYQMVCW